MTRIHKAMVLAAGLGTRMQPLTSHMPKPLVPVYGRALVDHVLDALAAAGVKEAVVNVHHLADMLEEHLADRHGPPHITISDERDQLLETGGGVRRALPLLGAEPFIAINSDTIWIEGAKPNLERLQEAFDPQAMDVLLLLAPSASSIGYEGQGDFHMDAFGRLSRRGERLVAPFIYAGAAILKPELFQDTPEGPFSLNLIFDRSGADGRLYGVRLDGTWMHVGTPDAIALAEEAIQLSGE